MLMLMLIPSMFTFQDKRQYTMNEPIPRTSTHPDPSEKYHGYMFANSKSICLSKNNFLSGPS